MIIEEYESPKILVISVEPDERIMDGGFIDPDPGSGSEHGYETFSGSIEGGGDGKNNAP